MTDFSLPAFDLARSSKFTGRLQYLLGQYAKVIVTTSGPSANSKNLAARIQSDPGGMTGKIAVSFVSDGGVRNTSDLQNPADSTLTDAQLDGVIQAIWNSGAWDNII